MDILIMSLFGAVVVAVLMHLHFKHAPDARVALVSPQVFAVAGCLIGISAGMIWFQDDERRIFLEHGVVHALAGAAVGGLAGVGAKAGFERLDRTRVIAVVLSLMLLAASVGAPVGWLYGSVVDADGTRELTPKGMIWGGAIGCFAGFALGLIEACFGGGSPKGDAPAKAENAAS